MNRYKRIYILLGVLALACIVTVAVSRYEVRKEQIANSDEIILEIPEDTVQALSWSYDEESLSFRREDTWLYDDDEAFPVDQEKIGELLEPFQAFGVSFIIEDVEDFGQYGLDDPVCTITLTTEEETYEIQLGDFSAMDEQRYVSIGDGNVYLVSDDPLDTYGVVLSDLIDHDDVPSVYQADALQFSGAENYQILYQEEGGDTYREDDVYFAQRNGESLPLDTDRVEDYLSAVSGLDLTNYITYNATEDEIAACGLDDPQLTIQIDYTVEDEDGAASAETFLLHISRDPEQLAAIQEEAASDEDADSGDETEETIIAYARVGDSPILYEITASEYTSLMAASYDNLRHLEVLPADFADIVQADISLEGETYTITAQGDEDERTYLYQEEELDISAFQSALEALSADTFTSQKPDGKEEISLTVTLDGEDAPEITIGLFRYDGSYCLAVVDGEPLCLVDRSAVVDLVEAVNAIVLN